MVTGHIVTGQVVTGQVVTGQLVTGRPGRGPAMVGRTAALSQLVQLYDATSVPCTDPPTFALVAGEGGIGKTRLMRALVDVVRDAAGDGSDPPVVLAGGAEPDSLDRPFSVAASVLGHWVDSDRTERWVEAFVELLRDRRGLVVVEDLHWADGQSVAVIDQLSRARLTQLLVVGSYRPEELSRRLPGGELLSRLERRQLVERVRLEPLTRPEVGLLLTTLLDAPPNSATIEALHLRSGGNPFVVEELVASCCASGPEELVAASLPWSLEDAVRSRLEGLEPVERRVIDAASVCGSASAFDVLLDVGDVSEDELITVLRSLVDQGLLVETSEDHFDFRHALVRSAVGSQLLGRERRRLHQRALDALTQRSPSDIATRARLAAGAGRYDDLVDLAHQGVRSYLDRGSSFVALRLADLALREEPDDKVLRAAATEAAWLVGLDHEALQHALHWRGCVGDDPSELVDALTWLVRVHYELDEEGPYRACRAELEKLVSGLPEGHPAFARGAAAMAQVHMLRAEVDDAVAWSERAEQAAQRLGDQEVAVQARIERWSALVQQMGEAARAGLEAAIKDAEANDLWVLAARGLNNLFELTPMYVPGGDELLARYRAASERAGFDWSAMSSTHFREIDRAFRDGDQAGVRQGIERVAESARFHPRVQAWVRELEVYLMLEEGRLERAESSLVENLDEEREPDACHPHGASLFTTRGLQLAVAARRGDAEAAGGLLEQLVALPLGGDRPTLNAVLEFVASARAAGVTAERVELLALPWLASHPDGAGAAEFAAAFLALEREPVGAAERMVVALDDPWLPLRLPVRATFHLDVAQAFLAAGDRERAAAHVERAERALHRWPGWRRDRAAALRRRLDSRGAQVADGELTVREREVASLLAEGLTNGQLAARLFISPKTAAVHVSNILMKLQMSSRAEIAAWAVRTGLASEPVAG